MASEALRTSLAPEKPVLYTLCFKVIVLARTRHSATASYEQHTKQTMLILSLLEV